MSTLWTIDEEHYKKLQRLKEFIDFVSGLPLASESDKQKASEIKRKIETIDRTETFIDWAVCLNIFDREVQENRRSGVYWRSWSVYFENNTLDIEAMTRHSEGPLGHWGEDFHFCARIDFTKEVIGRRIYMDQELDLFLKDAMSYLSYVTENLSDVEVDIDVF